jgi:DNA repair exonuclease SbcCD ATPase subunit
MRLISVTVTNYRIHKETTVFFDPARTVIGGPNESGKSTIIEAIHRALFLRSRTTGAVLESMQSGFHPGHPAVTLAFESGGETYTIAKQFTGTAHAPTTLTRSGGDPFRGEAAEAEIHRILNAETVGGGRGLEDRLPLQWAHLWVWQGAGGRDPLHHAKGRPLEQLRDRLGTLGGGGVLESPRDARVSRTILDTHAATSKDDGSPRKDSPLFAAATERAAAAAAEDAALSALTTLHAAADEVESADSTIAECEASLATTRQEQNSLRDRIDEASRLTLTLGPHQVRANDATRDLQALEDADCEISECERIIRELEERLKPANDRLSLARENERSAAARFELAVKRVHESQTHQAALADHAMLHSLCEQLERIQTDRLGLAGRCDAIAALRLDLAALRNHLADLPTITAEDLSLLTGLERKQDGAQATLDAIATRIELLTADREVALGGHAIAVGTGETITTEAELVVGDGVRIRIAPGGGTSLIEATRRRDEARLALDRRLTELGIESVDVARRVQPQRQSLGADIQGKEIAIRDLGGDKAAEDLQQRDKEIGRFAQRISELAPPGFTRPNGLDAALAAKATSEDAYHAFAREASQGNADLEAADALRAAAAEDARRAEESLRSSDEQLRTRRGRLQSLVEKHGTDRAGTLDTLRTAQRAALAAVTTSQKRLDELQHDTLERSRQRLERAVEAILERQRAAQTTRAIALDRLRQEGTANPSEDLARAKVRRQLAESRQDQAAREARAIALLASLFTQKKREVESQFVGPLTNRAAEYLRCVYGPETRVAVEYRDGAFDNLTVARPAFGNARLGFDSLSGGGREQVAAALRLAMAEILAVDHDGCLPIVFDDAFVNSDPARTRALQDMLDLAAERGLQVIVLSCNHRDYETLGAPLVELNRGDLTGLSPRRIEPTTGKAPAEPIPAELIPAAPNPAEPMPAGESPAGESPQESDGNRPSAREAADAPTTVSPRSGRRGSAARRPRLP